MQEQTSELLKLSVSKTKTFLDCKAKYKFNYILKLPKTEADYFTLGKLCHRVLEYFHNQYINGCTSPYNLTMNDAFKIAYEEFKEKTTPEMKKEAWEIINNYLKQISANKMPNIIAVEKQFSFPMTDYLTLNGAIDIIQIDEDDIVHVKDYKTSKNKKYLKDDFFQLLTYAYYILNFEKTNAQKIRASYIMLRHGSEHITETFSKDQILDIKNEYIKYAEQIMQEKEFPTNPTFLCNYCPFLKSCESGMKATNLFSGEVDW